MILMMMATKKFYLEAVRGRLIALKSRSETAKLEGSYFQTIFKLKETIYKVDCTEEQIRDSQTEEKLFSKLIKFHL